MNQPENVWFIPVWGLVRAGARVMIRLRGQEVPAFQVRQPEPIGHRLTMHFFNNRGDPDLRPIVWTHFLFRHV